MATPSELAVGRVAQLLKKCDAKGTKRNEWVVVVSHKLVSPVEGRRAGGQSRSLTTLAVLTSEKDARLQRACVLGVAKLDAGEKEEVKRVYLNMRTLTDLSTTDLAATHTRRKSCSASANNLSRRTTSQRLAVAR